MAEDNALANTDPREALYGKKRAHLLDPSSEVGMIPPSLYKALDGEVESSASVQLMHRIAFAVIREFDVEDRTAPGGARPANLYDKLQSVGCPVEVWHQAARHPEFKSILKQAVDSAILLGKLPNAFRSMSEQALDGNMDAYKEFTKALRLGDDPDEEGVRKQLRSLDDASFEGEVSGLLDKANSLYGKLIAPRVTQDRTKEILDGQEVLEPPPEEEPLDHGKIHGDANE